MKRIVLTASLLLLCLAAAASALEVPKTTAGRAFTKWIEALDRADDESAIRAYITAAFGERLLQRESMEEHVARFRRIAADFAGTRPAVIEKSTDLELVVLGQTKSGEWARIRLRLQDSAPHRIDGIGIAEAEPPGSEPSPAESNAALVAGVRAYVDSIAAQDRFSGVVLIAHDGAPVFEGAWGAAHRRYGVPNHIDTRFNLGSMNKMFTAVAIAQLVEARKLDWEDRVGKHLPDYPNKRVRDDVTIRHLITHRSGMGTHFTDQFLKASRLLYREPADYLPLFVNEPLAFEPGSTFAYSNAGFFVLGMIIEAASGENYFDYIRDHIYRPAGMLATDSYDSDGTEPNLAMGYYDDDGVLRENTLLHSVKGTPAGGGYSTVGDLNRFGKALLDGRLISRKALDLMIAWTSDRDTRDGIDRGYGYGFTLYRTKDGVFSFGHGGGFPGVNGTLEVYPALGYTVASLANMDGGAEKVASRIQGMLPRR